MPYRRTFRKRAARPYRRRTVRPTRQVTTLAKRVNGLARRMRQQNTSIILTRSSSTNAVSPVNIYGLDQYNLMSPIFGTLSNDLHGNRVLDKSDAMDITVSLENIGQSEPDTVNFTCYLVQLKDAIGGAYAGLGALALTSAQHYTTFPTLGANALLNLKFFRILKTKKFTLTNYGNALTSDSANTGPIFKRWTWKVKRNALIQNPDGDFNTRGPVDPSQARFLLVFSDNLTSDSQSPVVQINHVKSLTQIN